MLESVQQRDGRWCVVDMRGKGNRIRTVAIPSWAKAAVDRWVSAAGFSSGRVFRPVNRGGNVAGDSMTAQSIYEVVKSYASDFAPHDLRRSFAKLAHRGHAPLEQIQISLGHASIQTTERYLGVRQDLANAPCDVLGLRLGT
jgi:integrase